MTSMQPVEKSAWSKAALFGASVHCDGMPSPLRSTDCCYSVQNHGPPQAIAAGKNPGLMTGPSADSILRLELSSLRDEIQGALSELRSYIEEGRALHSHHRSSINKQEAVVQRLLTSRDESPQDPGSTFKTMLQGLEAQKAQAQADEKTDAYDETQGDAEAEEEELVLNSDGVKKPKRKSMFAFSKSPNIQHDDVDVSHYYYKTGFAQLVARNATFINGTLGIIAMNAVYIGIDADNNPADSVAASPLGFKIVENMFCAYFFLEWLVRFSAFQRKLDCLKDGWFKFDSVLCFLMVMETWVFPFFAPGTLGPSMPTGVLKLFRLLRLFRMTRLLKAFPELLAMLRGVRAASRAVGSALMMLIVLTYLFSILMHMILNYSEEDPEYERLGDVMWTLLMDGVFLDSIGKLTRQFIAGDQWIALAIFMLFVLASAMTVMNMLIGVLCEVVSAVAARDKEDAAVKLIKDTLLVLLKRLDSDGSGMISQSEVSLVLKDRNALDVLSDLHIDIKSLLFLLEMHYSTESELPISDIINLILMMRGDRAPTIKDITYFTSVNRFYMEQVKTSFLQMEQRLLGLP